MYKLFNVDSEKKMKFNSTYFIIILFTFSFQNCALTGLFTPAGSAFIKIDSDAVTIGPATTFAKFGEACSYNIMGIVSFGDTSIRKAMENGGLKKVGIIDRSILSLFFLYGKVCVEVYGE